MVNPLLHQNKKLLWSIWLVVFVALLLLWAPIGRAQSVAPEQAPTINSVQPSTLLNDVPVEIIVTGSGFVNGSVVLINNFGGLETTYVSANVLRASVPPGLPPGGYSVRVVNPDGSAADMPNALNVIAPAGPSPTPEPSLTPAPTAFIRPLLVVSSYGASSAQIAPGQNLDFEMTLANAGQATATNVVATFAGGDFIARNTGGVRAIGSLAPGQEVRFWQPLFATADLRGKSTAVLQVTATYTDINGQSYDSTFDLTFPVVPVAEGGIAATATPTPTPTTTPTPGPRPRPQLIVTTNSTDPPQLQPGSRFTLALTVQNLGETNARNVTVILGGGSGGGGSTIDGTPDPGGGLSGAGGSFSEFAPIGTSNVSTIGDLAVNDSRQITQELIVNTTTKPGAYPVKVSFVYTDNSGANFVDDQVITLLGYQRPQVEMGFYTQAPTLFAGQMGSLPLQLVNTGRETAVFGNFSVSAEGADLMNNAMFVGALESGGFFTMDAMITPFEPGLLELTVKVAFTDDFRQPAVISDTLTVEVMEAMPMEPPEMGEGMGDEEFPMGDNGGQETLWQRILRFLRGLFGLGSGSNSEQPQREGMPFESGPMP